MMNFYTSIHKRLEKSLDGQQHFPFIMLAGPSDLGKRQLVQQVIHQKLGSYSTMDLLHIRDMSNSIGKSHIFPVKQPAGEAKKYTDSEGLVYDNIGAREIRDRLALSSTGDIKIVFIENIERATIAAANALLKHLEEPLPGRYIIATTSSPDNVLQTLHSRALTICMSPIEEEKITEHLVQEYGIPSLQAQTISRLSAGKPMRAKNIVEQDELQSLIDGFEDLNMAIEKGEMISILQKLKSIDTKNWSLYLDAMIQVAISRSEHHIVDALIEYAKYRNRNVHAENSLTQLSMQLTQST